VNGLTPPKAGVTDWPPGHTSRAARGAPEPSEAFAGILDATQARTATAEGQDRSSRTRSNSRREEGPNASERAEARSNAEWARERRAADGVERDRPVQHHGDDAPAPADAGSAQDAGEAQQLAAETGAPVEAPAAAAVVVPTALLVEAPAAAPAVASVSAPVQAQAVVAAAVAGGLPQAAGEPAVAAVARAQAAPVAQVPVEGEAAPSAAQALAATEADAPVEAGGQPVAKQPVGAERNAVPAAQNGAAASQSQQQSANQNGASTHDQPGTLPQQAAEQARTVAQAYGRASGPRQPAADAPAPQAPATPVATPVAPAATVQAAAARAVGQATPVPLSHAAENVEHVLRLGSTRGTTHARIALNPVELGSIDVHLRQTAEGLVARVVAHAPEAVLQLQQAGDDLRRSLEQQGVNLLSLDIGHSGDERSAGRAGTSGDHEGDRDGSGQPADGSADGEAELTTTTTLQLPNGVLVDVLA
jgi:flagellar hook-length control protein FliK